MIIEGRKRTKMCKKQIWKRGLLSLGLAAMCFLAEPAGMWVYATEDAQTPGTEGQPADAAVTQPPEMQSEAQGLRKGP